jgi:hypothetical protein
MIRSRVIADRRSGVDHRADPRRRSVTSVSEERRRVVDRRRGAERRSTLDRRRRRVGSHSVETPAEHIRNALQLLHHLAAREALNGDNGGDLAAAVERLRRALSVLERRHL